MNMLQSGFVTVSMEYASVGIAVSISVILQCLYRPMFCVTEGC
jgi:hypothetical protein